MLLDNKNWNKLAKGNLEVICQLDQRGFLIGENENLSDYIKRLQEWEHFYQKHISQNSKDVSIEGQRFRIDELISKKIMFEGQKNCQDIYFFRFDSFAGFFTKKLHLFFAAATFFPRKIFFPFFVLKSSFKKRKSFLFCHIARAALNSIEYEEFFAYYLSKNFLRKKLGGLFKRSFEVLLFLLFLLINIGIQALFLLGLIEGKFILANFYIILSSVVFLGLRQVKTYSNFKRAKKNLLLNNTSQEAILFRCSDKEINKIKKRKIRNKEELAKIISNPLRYRVIEKRFLL